MTRSRVRTPPPQLAEHDEKGCHGPTAQSAGHACSLHACCCERSLGQSLALLVIVRWREREPPAHGLVHDDHESHCVTSHEHCDSEQLVMSVSGSHALPPYCGDVVTVRVRDLLASPHVALHELHELQLLSAQSIGHGERLHGSLCDDEPVQAAPHALLSGDLLRERVRVPVVPHVCVHVPQLPQLPHSQSIVGVLALHCVDSDSGAVQAAPPQVGSVLLRVR